jgi:hypothetical protein
MGQVSRPAWCAGRLHPRSLRHVHLTGNGQPVEVIPSGPEVGLWEVAARLLILDRERMTGNLDVGLRTPTRQ